MIRYFALLKHYRDYRILFSTAFICSFGVWFSHIGIFTLLIELNAPVWAVSACAALAFLPNVFLAPINGVIVDKFKPKPLLISMYVIEMLTIFGLIFIDDLKFLWLLLLIVVVRSMASSLFFHTQTSALPKILSFGALKLANEMTSILWTISYTFGMAFAGIFVHYFGVQMAFIFDFVLYFVAFFVLIRVNLSQIVIAKTKKATSMLKEGIFYLRKNPLVTHFILIHAVVAVTTYDNLVALLAQYRYKEILSASLVIGLINLSRSVSAFFGQIWLSKIVNKTNFVYLLLAQGAAIMLWGALEANFWLSFIGLIAAGFCITTIWSYSFTQLQKACDREFLGRIIAYNDMVYFIVASATSALIGLLYELGLSLKMIMFCMGAVFFVVAGYYVYVKNKYKF
ncbi:MAG: MFS transporter [Campylobacter sp.]|nr:MFS transporter [Campylobacter sp.]